MAINSPYRIGTDPYGNKTSGAFQLTSPQGIRNHPIYGGYDDHDGYDLVGLPRVTCTCGKADYECRCNTAKVNGKYLYPQKMIYSTTNGVIDFAGWQNSSDHTVGFGLYVRIKSTVSGQTNYYYYYGHLSEIASGITVGASVKEGTLIGIEGSTGSSTGSHCHYCVRINRSSDNAVNLEDLSGITNARGTYYDTRTADDVYIPDPEPPVEVTKYGVHIGGKFYSAHIYNGTKWVKATPKIYNGTKWVNCSE